jgi:hypothetical protein
MFPLNTLKAYEYSDAFVPTDKNIITLRKVQVTVVSLAT